MLQASGAAARGRPRLHIAIVLAALCATPSAAAPPSAPKTLSCDGVFARDSSYSRLVGVFGAANVRHTKVADPHEEVPASVVYLGDKSNWLEFHWRDEKARKGLSEVKIWGEKVALKTAGGLGIGAPLAKVVALNGKPISIQGFGTEVQGQVNFDGGALETLPGGCRFGLYLVPGPGAPSPPPDSIYGEASFPSTHPEMIKQNFVVGWMTIEWIE